VDLSLGREVVSIDIEGEPTLIWSGPAATPMAAATVFQLYGLLAMIEHPGLATFRVFPEVAEPSQGRSGLRPVDKQATGRIV